MSYYGNPGSVPPSGPAMVTFNMSMADVQAILQRQAPTCQDQLQTALVPKAKASKVKTAKNAAGILALGGPQHQTALVASAGLALASATSNQDYVTSVQDFSGTLSIVKPKKVAKPKPAKFNLALESNGSLQHETALVPSAGLALASATSYQDYGTSVQDFSGALSIVKPKKVAKPKPTKLNLALESNVNWPIVSLFYYPFRF